MRFRPDSLLSSKVRRWIQVSKRNRNSVVDRSYDVRNPELIAILKCKYRPEGEAPISSIRCLSLKIYYFFPAVLCERGVLSPFISSIDDELEVEKVCMSTHHAYSSKAVAHDDHFTCPGRCRHRPVTPSSTCIATACGQSSKRDASFARARLGARAARRRKAAATITSKTGTG